MADRHAFPAAGLDLHQRGMTYREFVAAQVMATLVLAASAPDHPNYDAGALAVEAVEAAEALCEALDHDLDPEEGEAPAGDA